MDIALTLKTLNIFAAMLWLVSAGLWALGAMVEARDNPNAFISDLQRPAVGIAGRRAWPVLQHW
jgi:hypothetical protein